MLTDRAENEKYNLIKEIEFNKGMLFSFMVAIDELGKIIESSTRDKTDLMTLLNNLVDDADKTITSLNILTEKLKGKNKSNE